MDKCEFMYEMVYEYQRVYQFSDSPSENENMNVCEYKREYECWVFVWVCMIMPVKKYESYNKYLGAE